MSKNHDIVNTDVAKNNGNNSTLTILTCHDRGQKKATKEFKVLQDGTIEKKSFSAGLLFSHEEHPVSCLDDLSNLLEELLDLPSSFPIRGAAKKSAAEIVRRKVHGNDAAFDPVARPYVMLDIDRQPYPDFMDIAERPEEVVRWVIELLPEPFRNTSCYYKFSSSQNVPKKLGEQPDKVVSLHVWLWCDRAVIHVYPDRSVVVDAPANTPLEKVKTRVIKRAKWIRKQQRYFDRYPPALPARKYVSGEAFRYLGKQYTLKIEQGIVSQVKLIRGQLYVHATYTNPKHIKELVDSWYRDKAFRVFEERFFECLKQVKRKIGVQHDGRFVLRTMKTRWGSCSVKNQIILNPELIAAPKECIDYVITHELCHVIEHNHSREFYKLIEKAMPDWKERKDKLEITMENRAL